MAVLPFLASIRCPVRISLLTPLLFLAWVPLAPAAEPVLLENFDGPAPLGERWTALGQIQVQRADVPGDVNLPGVAGKCIRCSAQAGAKLAVKPDFPRPKYETAQALRLRCDAAGVTEKEPLVVEFQVFSSQRRAWYWSKFTFDKPGWQTVELPLRYFRQSTGAALDWGEAYRLAVHFRNAGTLSLDDVELIPGEGKDPAYLTAEEVGKLAFGEKLKVYRNPHFAVVSDEPRLKADAVLAAFDKLYQAVFRDLPKLPRPRREVVCLVFAEDPRYRQFWGRLAESFHSQVPAPKSDGYTLFGIAGSSYSDKYGAVRPVWVHETCHAMLAQSLGVTNQSEWLHEGLANYYQLAWTGQDVHALTRNMIRDRKHVPLSRLASGKPIGTESYAQAVLLVEWMLQVHRDAFTAAILEMRQRTSTDLAPLATKHFGRPLDELETEWLEWADEQAR